MCKLVQAMKFLLRLIVTFLIAVVTAQKASKCESIRLNSAGTWSDWVTELSCLMYRHLTTGIKSSPLSTNTSLNGEAVFNCTFVGEVLVWEANERQIHHGQNGFEFIFVQLNATQSLRMSTLTVVVLPDKNHTNLTCTTYSTSPLSNKRSETALLLVQGIYHTWCSIQ